MKKTSFLLIALLVTVVVRPVSAQVSWDTIEYPQLNNFEKPDVVTFQLENGITFYLLEDHELPLINVRAIARTGGVLVPPEMTGLDVITGTVMRTGGTVDIPGNQLDELLENRAATLSTSIGLTSGSASLSVLKEDFDDLIPVFKDVLNTPALPQDRIDLVKTQIGSSIARRNDQQSGIAQREFRDLIYGEDSVYSRIEEYETIANISREDVIEFHRRSFTGRNLVIGVVGDFEMDRMRETLQAVFENYPAGQENELVFPDVNYEFESSINFVDKRDVNQSYILLGHIGGMRDNPDYASIQVMNRILSDGFTGRLMRIVRSQMGLAYSVSGSYGSGNFYPGTFTAGVMTQSATTSQAIDAVIEQIRRLQDERVGEEELQRTIDRFLNSIVFQYDSRASVLNEQMNYDYAGLPPDTFERLVEEIRSVTAGDIQRVAREYLRPDALHILVVGNGEEIGGQLDQFGTVNTIDITIPLPADN